MWPPTSTSQWENDPGRHKNATFAEDSDEDTASESSGGAKRDHTELVDLGGADADTSQLGEECGEVVAPRVLSNYPLKSVTHANSRASHQGDVKDITIKTR